MIANLTQHNASPEQVEAGVVELDLSSSTNIRSKMTFNNLPTAEELTNVANDIAATVSALGHTSAMIGGAPFFMSYLENALTAQNIQFMYAFSVRQSVETTNPDGSVTKTAVFKHLGFV
jgi:hypothetical protein